MDFGSLEVLAKRILDPTASKIWPDVGRFRML